MRRARSLSRILFLWAWARSWVKTSGMLSPVRAVSTPRASSMMTRLSSALCSCSARISLRRARARAGSDHPAPAPQPAAEQSRAISHPSDPSAKSQPEPPRLSARALRSIAGQPHVSLAAGPIRPTTALLLNPPPGRGHRWLRSRPWLPSAHAASHQRRNHPERTLTQTRSRSTAGRPRCSGSSPTSQTCRCGTTRSARPGRSPAARWVSARATGRPEHFPKQGDLCRRSPSSSRTAGSQYEMLSGLCAARSLTCSRQRETTPPSPTP